MSHRVVQWGTGNVGYHSLRHLIRHPDMELVGVHAHNPAKIGKDAAELAGLSELTGIHATDDVDALLALKPDCVVYTVKGETRPHEVVPELSRILSAGVNVASTSMIFFVYPPFADPSMRGPIEEACAAGKSTIYVSGMDPGFSGDVLPLAALQLAGRIDEIRCQELCDYSTYEDPEFTGVSFGFGRPADYSPPIEMPGVLSSGWGGMVQMIADRLGIKLDEIRESVERAYTDEAFDTPMMHVPAGTCEAVHFQLEGMAGGRPVVVAEHVNRMRVDGAGHWPKPPAGRAGVHRCIIKGNPDVQLECFVHGEDGDHNSGGVQATSMRVINAIPEICKHPGGMISTLDLPITPSLDVGGL